MISMNISRLNVTATEAMSTCGDWCRGQHYTWMTNQIVPLIILSIAVLVFMVWIDVTGHLHKKFGDEKMYRFRHHMYFFICFVQLAILYVLFKGAS